MQKSAKEACPEHSAESAEAHRGNAPTTKRTPETGAPHACSGAEFPEALGGAVKRLVLRACEDVRSGIVCPASVLLQNLFCVKIEGEIGRAACCARGPCATGLRESCQDREVAALSDLSCVPQTSLCVLQIARFFY